VTASLDRHGYAIADFVLTVGEWDEIVSSLPPVEERRGGVRNLVMPPALTNRFGDMVPVKVTLFDKTTASNWHVQWHQDRVIKTASSRLEPPAEVLRQMLAVRVHLDDCGPDNGPLSVIPGSHRLGKLHDEEIAHVVAAGPIVELHVPRGALILMRPLLLHASSSAHTPSHRRVLHIELAPRGGIEFDSYGPSPDRSLRP
jgi:ectoine hydroxylase-related dioxygenase (phytanoyl-CoA dioxygenase family)